MTDLVEVMARGIDPDAFNDRMTDTYASHAARTNIVRAKAKAALQALKDAGYAVVPVEPTEAMVAAGIQHTSAAWARRHVNGCYRAMIQASGCGHISNVVSKPRPCTVCGQLKIRESEQ